MKKYSTVFNKEMKGLVTLIALMSLMISCGKLSKNDINKKYSSGVVLIKTTGYYSAEMENGQEFFFTRVTEDGKLENLTFDESSIEYSMAFGTGFFISKDGLIATNKHVVSSPVSRKEAKVGFKQTIKDYQQYIVGKYKEYKDMGDELESVIRKKYAYNMDYSEEKEQYNNCMQEMKKMEKSYQYFSNMDFSNLEVTEHQHVSVAFNNTHVTNTSDFYDCVIRKESNSADLAVIQLKSKQTPEGRYIFGIPQNDPLNDYSISEKISNIFGSDKNEELYMIGFNSGVQLAMTNEGIKSQITSGSISQNNSDDVMYTIAAMHGSSGSPVLNRKGELVCINYAGIDITQSFNYGIKVKKLCELFN